MEESNLIHKEMTIEDIFTSFPQKSEKLAQEMTNVGLHCVGCSASTWETLEAGMLSHGMSDKDIDSLVSKLNSVLASQTDPTSITISEKAANKYRDVLKSEDKEGWGIRLAVKPGGCGGFEYSLDYAEKALENDDTFVSNGIEIYVNHVSLDRLLGSEIDYIDGLKGAGFKISNPNVKSSCSCGTSHSY